MTTSAFFRRAGFFGIAAMLLAPPTSLAGIESSKHNLSVNGPGSIKAASEAQICVFCHIPHDASPSAPLWSRKDPSGGYTPYGSSTVKAAPGQPSGASLLCLSCHDGTIALGDLLGRAEPVAMSGGVTTMPAGDGNLGTDLSDDHPVSIVYDSQLAADRGELADPSTLTGKVRLDGEGRLQCTSCHDPHDDSNGKFLVMPNAGSALCRSCHLKDFWEGSSHNLSTAGWNGAGADPWPHTDVTTVAANACENCHRPHSAGGRKWLLNHAREEDNCNSCHNGNVALKKIEPEFNKTSAHPVSAGTGVHDAAEATVAQSRHVECVDCHNPHAANTDSGALPGSLAGLRGITISGAEIEPITEEYQLCFRCHADSPDKPSPYFTRQYEQTNTRLEFDTANPSYHPVAGPGRSLDVPSLKAPWTTASVISCGDCHNNNAGPGAGGVGPNGPHGSNYPFLLERQYNTIDRIRTGTAELPSTYALCYKCHDFKKLHYSNGAVSSEVHRVHVFDEGTPCSTCHDPHGVSATQGNFTTNLRLLNWNTALVKPDSKGRMRWERSTPGHGRCYLTCHGEDHFEITY
jgi:predicted CXXCH cytochrome family protein